MTNPNQEPAGDYEHSLGYRIARAAVKIPEPASPRLTSKILWTRDNIHYEEVNRGEHQVDRNLVMDGSGRIFYSQGSLIYCGNGNDEETLQSGSSSPVLNLDHNYRLMAESGKRTIVIGIDPTRENEDLFHLPDYKNEYPITNLIALPPEHSGNFLYLVTETNFRRGLGQTYIYNPNRTIPVDETSPPNLLLSGPHEVLETVASKDRIAISCKGHGTADYPAEILIFDRQGKEIEHAKIQDPDVATYMLLGEANDLYYLTISGQLKFVDLPAGEAGKPENPREILDKETGFVSITKGPSGSVLAVKHDGTLYIINRNKTADGRPNFGLQKINLLSPGQNRQILELVTDPAHPNTLAYVCQDNTDRAKDLKYTLVKSQLEIAPYSTSEITPRREINYQDRGTTGTHIIPNLAVSGSDDGKFGTAYVSDDNFLYRDIDFDAQTHPSIGKTHIAKCATPHGNIALAGDDGTFYIGYPNISDRKIFKLPHPDFPPYVMTAMPDDRFLIAGHDKNAKRGIFYIFDPQSPDNTFMQQSQLELQVLETYAVAATADRSFYAYRTLDSVDQIRSYNRNTTEVTINDSATQLLPDEYGNLFYIDRSGKLKRISITALEAGKDAKPQFMFPDEAKHEFTAIVAGPDGLISAAKRDGTLYLINPTADHDGKYDYQTIDLIDPAAGTKFNEYLVEVAVRPTSGGKVLTYIVHTDDPKIQSKYYIKTKRLDPGIPI